MVILTSNVPQSYSYFYVQTHIHFTAPSVFS